MISANIGMAATFICVLFSGRIATAFLRHNPRMFTVMALLACAWTLVLGFYRFPGEKMLGDLVTDLASFLFVYIGALLMVDAEVVDKHNTKTVPLQSLGLVLLAYIAVPKDFSMAWPDGSIWSLSVERAKDLISYGLDLAGMVAIAFGVYAIASRRLFITIAIVMAAYELFDGWHYYNGFVNAAPKQLEWYEYLAYAVLKLAFTGLFGCIVCYRGMTAKDRAKGPVYWVLHFFALAGQSVRRNDPRKPAG